MQLFPLTVLVIGFVVGLGAIAWSAYGTYKLNQQFRSRAKLPPTGPHRDDAPPTNQSAA